jgi:hypothetical protein
LAGMTFTELTRGVYVTIRVFLGGNVMENRKNKLLDALLFITLISTLWLPYSAIIALTLFLLKKEKKIQSVIFCLLVFALSFFFIQHHTTERKLITTITWTVWYFWGEYIQRALKM